MWNDQSGSNDTKYPLILSHDWNLNPGNSAGRSEIHPINSLSLLQINPTVNPTTYTEHTLGSSVVGKTALIQGPVDDTSFNSLTPIWEQPQPGTFNKKEGYIYNMRLDFMYDPTLYDKDVLHNAQVFLVKIVNFAKSYTSASALIPGTAAWTQAESFLDASGDIHGSSLTKNIHYSPGVGDNGTVTLSPRYFNVLHKFNLAVRYTTHWVCDKFTCEPYVPSPPSCSLISFSRPITGVLILVLCLGTIP